jgi:hypothetical protein
MTRGPGPHDYGDPTRAFSTRGAVSPGRDTYGYRAGGTYGLPPHAAWAYPRIAQSKMIFAATTFRR